MSTQSRIDHAMRRAMRADRKRLETEAKADHDQKREESHLTACGR